MEHENVQPFVPVLFCEMCEMFTFPYPKRNLSFRSSFFVSFSPSPCHQHANRVRARVPGLHPVGLCCGHFDGSTSSHPTTQLWHVLHRYHQRSSRGGIAATTTTNRRYCYSIVVTKMLQWDCKEEKSGSIMRYDCSKTQYVEEETTKGKLDGMYLV